MKSRARLFLASLFLLAILVVVAVFSRSTADSAKLQIYFFNVGQGDSSYIKTDSGEDILIDGGPDDSVLQELGKVMNIGDRRIDLVVLTHPHADHLNGLMEVVDRYEIGEVWETKVEYSSSTYDAWKEKIKNKNIKSTATSAGLEKKLDSGAVKFLVLYPLSSLENKKIDNVNNASIINSITSDNFSALFLGDAEKTAQKEILNNLSTVKILKVAHHGAENGMLEDLLKIIRPRIAVISVGAKNNYGHPHKSSIELLKSYIVQIYRTDQNGTIKISWDGKNYNIHKER